MHLVVNWRPSSVLFHFIPAVDRRWRGVGGGLGDVETMLTAVYDALWPGVSTS